MTEHEYFWAWTYYLGAAGVFYLCFWYASRKWWRDVKHIARALLAAVLFTPWYSDGGYHLLAPAWLSSVADMLLERDGGFFRAGTPLLAALCLAMLIATALAFIKRKKKPEPRRGATERKAA
ncbi:hypothetical protein [Agaribacterium haliotis]|uniref:hypothetical protein n=1 Tax=Agaribacterium haliotis TaxID=2013869 RepID=UPI000BB548FB|nr:hypothetical protein [Agaribacterium haliotis]